MNKACPLTTVAESTPIIVVGPTHPYTGGISQHTTRLALELEKAGHCPVVESWRAQYPARLYPGTPTVPDGEPEIGLPRHITTQLAWYWPWSWWQAGRRHRGARLLVSIPTAFHAIPYTVMRAGATRASEMWGIVHNVIPHDAGRLGRKLMGWFLRRLDHLIVHSESARRDAVTLGCDEASITVVDLPSPWPTEEVAPAPPGNTGGLRALFFGTIRAYKGLDLLCRAIAECPGVSLHVAGEFWEDRQRYDELIDLLGIADRVTVTPGYLPHSRFREVFQSADVLVMPYRGGTGSIVSDVGFRFGIPVIATQTGSIAHGVEHDVTGLVVEPGSVSALVEALTVALDEATRKRWSEGVVARQNGETQRWADYVSAVTAVH
jgi:D-inositol-3-phosphate glycosyltransferase